MVVSPTIIKSLSEINVWSFFKIKLKSIHKDKTLLFPIAGSCKVIANTYDSIFSLVGMVLLAYLSLHKTLDMGKNMVSKIYVLN